MANRTAPLLLRALVEGTDVLSYKVLKGNLSINNVRHLGSCGILANRRASAPLTHTAAPVTAHCRSFINIAAPLITRKIEHSESRTLGFSPKQMYDVVANVEQYQQFVPWCKRSKVTKVPNGDVRAKLEIGFPPFTETYTSDVTVVPNHQVRAVCTNGSLFSHLETVWRFTPGPASQPESCKVDFYVSFEFKSVLHSQLATVFFDEVVKQMVNAFEKRATKLYGPCALVQEVPLKRCL